MLKGVSPFGAQVVECADSTPLGTGAATARERLQNWVRGRGLCKEKKVLLQPIHPRLGGFKPDVHLVVGEGDRKSF